MIKIFVTGDNHIGKKYDNHNQRDRIVQERIDAIRRMVKKANGENCNLFAVTGDLFDKANQTSVKNIKEVTEILSDFHGTVVVLPGNHDYYDPETKCWQDFNKQINDIGNIVLLNEYAPKEIEVGDSVAIIYPAFCDSLHSESGENRLGWMSELDIPDDDGKFHIGMAHGAVVGESLDREGLYYLMTHGELNEIPVDIWLIGHTHVPFPNDLTDKFSEVSENIFNPGTHVQTDVSNNTEGMGFIIEIDENKNIKAKKYVPSDLRFYEKYITVSENKAEQIILDELKSCGDNSIVKLFLKGTVSDDEYDRRAEIIEAATERFLECDYDDGEITKAITEERINKEFPETSISARLLKAVIDQPAEAQLVYDMLKEIKEGK